MMCTREAGRLHRMGATDGFGGSGQGGLKDLLNQKTEPLIDRTFNLEGMTKK